jgi:hypothetical protein
MPSYYAPDNRTLVAAPDETLRKPVVPKPPATPGAALARARLVRGHHDLYVSVDVSSLFPPAEAGQGTDGQGDDRDGAGNSRAAETNQGRDSRMDERAVASTPPTVDPNLGLLQMMGGGQLPPEVASALEVLKLIRAVELTINLSNGGPISLVAHGTDPQSAQQLETMITESLKMSQDAMTATAAGQTGSSDDPVAKAMNAYAQRMAAKWASYFRPQRNGTAVTLFKNEGDSPERRLVANAIGWVVTAAYTQDLPALMSAAGAGPPDPGMMPMGGMPGMDPSQFPGAMPMGAQVGRDEMPRDGDASNVDRSQPYEVPRDRDGNPTNVDRSQPYEVPRDRDGNPTNVDRSQPADDVPRDRDGNPINSGREPGR